jgi:bla regulator protein BlaR1
MISSLANHLWQSTLFAAVAGLLTLALRKNRANMRHWIWLIASVKFLIPFSLLVSIGGQMALKTAPRDWPSVIGQISQPFVSPVLAVAAAPKVAGDLMPSLLLADLAWAAWICGFAAVAIFWFVRWRRMAALVRAASPLQLETPIQVMSSPALLEPGVFGILRPVLLLPDGIADRLTRSQLDAILAHELCHVRRRDNLASTIHMVVEALFWFHPLVWWIGSRLVDERERACDEEVLRLGNAPQVYAESILEVCRLYLESPLVCVSGITGADLKKRVEAIMTHRIAHKLDFGRRLLLVASGIASVAGPIAIGIVNAPRVQAQAQAGTTSPLAFEVASIRLSKPKPGTHAFIGAAPGGQRLTATNLPLKFLIIMAYNITNRQISGGPSWLDSEGYDIDAKAERPVSRDQLYLMLQTLLADRFKLTLHRETRELQVYALVVEKDGPKFKLHPNQDVVQPLVSPGGRGQVNFQNVPVSRLAWFLSTQLDRSVLDKTGLDGNYDFTLEWTPDRPSKDYVPDTPPPDPSGPSIFTALQRQLGLKLESQKGPVEFLRVEHAEKPTEN